MRSDELYLRDILIAIHDVSEFLIDYDLTRFVQDRVMRRAVLQALTEIGEAANHVSEELKQRYSSVPWEDARAFRNFAVHQYFAIQWNIVWDTATINVPDLHTHHRDRRCGVSRRMSVLDGGCHIAGACTGTSFLGRLVSWSSRSGTELRSTRAGRLGGG